MGLAMGLILPTRGVEGEADDTSDGLSSTTELDPSPRATGAAGETSNRLAAGSSARGGLGVVGMTCTVSITSFRLFACSSFDVAEVRNPVVVVFWQLS